MEFPPSPLPALPALPQVQPDPGVRGFQVDLSPVANAQIAPVIEPRGFIAAAGAGAAFGKALTTAGDLGLKLIDEQNASINRRKVEQARIMLQVTHDHIAKLQVAEPDETKWGSIFDREAAKVQTSLLADDSLSPLARDEIKGEIQNFTVRGKTGTELSSASESFRREYSLMEGGRLQALQNGNVSLANEYTHKLWAAGQLSDEARDRQLSENAAGGVMHLATTHPEDFLKTHPQPPADMPGPLFRKATLAAQKSARSRQGTLADQFLAAVASNKLEHPDDARDWAAAQPHLDPSLTKRLRTFTALFHSQPARDKIRDTAPETASRLDSLTDDFDPQCDGANGYWKLRLEGALLPEPWRTRATAQLDAKFRGRPSPALPPLESMARNLTLTMLRRGDFGPYDRPLPASSSPSTQSIPSIPSIPPRTIRDQAAWQRAINTRATLDGQFHRWLTLNPNASESSAKKTLLDLLPDASRARLFDALMDSAARTAPARRA